MRRAEARPRAPAPPPPSEADNSQPYRLLHNLVLHHAGMMDGNGKWHYKSIFEERLHDCLAGPPGVDPMPKAS